MRHILVTFAALSMAGCLSGGAAFGGPMLDTPEGQEEMVPCVEVSELFEMAAVARILCPGPSDAEGKLGAWRRPIDCGRGAEPCVPTSIAYFDCFVNKELSVVLD